MSTENITKWSFRDELETMVVSCIELKENTAKRKVKNILNKYDEIISDTKEVREYYKEEFHKISSAFNTLKSGVIKYKRGENEGRLLLKDIEQIEIREKDVLVITKVGREIILGTDFKYLKELF